MSSTSSSSGDTTSLMPAAKPPPGQTSDFVNPPSWIVYCHLAVGLCVGVSTVVYLIRCYVRFWIKRIFIFEDFLVFMSWVSIIVLSALVEVLFLRLGAGEHLWDVTKDEAKEFAYYFYISSVEYGIGVCIVKVSVLWLYRRVFATSRKSFFQITVTGIILILAIFYLVTTFLKIFQCQPRQKSYDKSLPGTCIDLTSIYTASGLFNTITDFIILLLPIKGVWKLKTSLRKKLIIVLVFTFGLCAPVFSAIGFVVRIRVTADPDVTWDQPQIALWGLAEITTGMLCVCLPEFGVIFSNKRFKKGSRSSRPSQSVLENARGAIAASRRKSAHTTLNNSITTPSSKALVPSATYFELNDVDTSSTSIRPSARGEEELHISPGVVHVRYDIEVESHESRSSSAL